MGFHLYFIPAAVKIPGTDGWTDTGPVAARGWGRGQWVPGAELQSCKMYRWGRVEGTAVRPREGTAQHRTVRLNVGKTVTYVIVFQHS